MENIGIWIRTQESDVYSKGNTGMLCQNMGQEQEQEQELELELGLSFRQEY